MSLKESIREDRKKTLIHREKERTPLAGEKNRLGGKVEKRTGANMGAWAEFGTEHCDI